MPDIDTEIESAAEVTRLRRELEKRIAENAVLLARLDDANLASERSWNERESYRLKLETLEFDAKAQDTDYIRRISGLRKRVELLEQTLSDRTEFIAALQHDLEAKTAKIVNLGAHFNVMRQAADERLILLTSNEESHRRAKADLESRLAFAGLAGLNGAGFPPSGAPETEELAELRRIAQERLDALNSLSVEAERRAAMLAELTSLVEEQNRAIESLRSETRPKR